MVIVDHPGTTYSHAALTSLLDCDAALVVCGRDHLPKGMLLPFADHSQVVWRVDEQIARDVRSGDTTNREAQAAKVYWSAWLINPDVETPDAELCFRRNPEGISPNNMLNYGYAILRAAVAKCNQSSPASNPQPGIIAVVDRTEEQRLLYQSV